MRLTCRVDRERRNQIHTNTSTAAATVMANAKIVERSKKDFGAIVTSETDDEPRTEGACFCVSNAEFPAESAITDDLLESLSVGEAGTDTVVDATRVC